MINNMATRERVPHLVREVLGKFPKHERIQFFGMRLLLLIAGGKELKCHTPISPWINPLSTLIDLGYLHEIMRAVETHPCSRDIQLTAMLTFETFAEHSNCIWVEVLQRQAIRGQFLANLNHDRPTTQDYIGSAEPNVVTEKRTERGQSGTMHPRRMLKFDPEPHHITHPIIFSSRCHASQASLKCLC